MPTEDYIRSEKDLERVKRILNNLIKKSHEVKESKTEFEENENVSITPKKKAKIKVKRAQNTRKSMLRILAFAGTVFHISIFFVIIAIVAWPKNDETITVTTFTPKVKARTSTAKQKLQSTQNTYGTQSPQVECVPYDSTEIADDKVLKLKNFLNFVHEYLSCLSQLCY